jgi:hypothetical protein
MLPRMTLGMTALLSTVLIAACGGNDSKPMPTEPTPPTTPTPPPVTVTANSYILPDAVKLGPNALGDHPLVVYKGERWHIMNIDQDTHALVADDPNATDFQQTEPLGYAGEQSFIMTKLGTTTFHCRIHPQMTGTLIVQEH